VHTTDTQCAISADSNALKGHDGLSKGMSKE